MFTEEWSSLPLKERRRIRRMVRIGRLPEDPGDARLAEAFAAHQRTRPWWRGFWFWFVPGLVLALGVAATIHPIVVGIVLASAGQAILVRRNTTRIARRADPEPVPT